MNRILYVFSSETQFRTHWRDRLLFFSAHGYDVHVAFQTKDLKNYNIPSIKIHNIFFHRGKPSFLSEIRTLISLISVFYLVKPEIVHAVSTKPVIYSGLIRFFVKIPNFVASITGLGYLFSDEIRKNKILFYVIKSFFRLSLFRKQTLTVFENPDDRDELVNFRIIEKLKTFSFVGGGIDVDHFTYKYFSFEENPKVVMISRILKDKGVIEFVNAVKILKKRGIKAKFILVGDIDLGNPNSFTPKDVEKWVEEDSIEYLGFQKNIKEIIETSHIVCLPSYREGAPMALIEAAAIGRPCVTTDVPGCRHVVQEGETGLLVPPRDAESLAQALQRLIRDPELCRVMGEKARKHAENHFSSTLACQRMATVYETFPLKENLYESSVKASIRRIS
jgi:glycosyltransferase involved in cell wall biosynthesis